MKFAFIEAERATWPVRPMCRVLRVESVHDREDRRLGVLIRESHERSRRIYGRPRIHEDLKEWNVRVSAKRVGRAMREHGIFGRTRRRFVRTTDSAHDQPVAPNLLERDFTAARPDERRVGDVTYLYTPEGTLYLATIMDLYSRRIVGWATSAVNDRRLALKALSMAVRRRHPTKGLIHHTDRGSPYASEDYQVVLDGHELVCSMSRRGNCLDNAAIESWHSTLKNELGERFVSMADANRKLFDHIEVFYNNQRRHSTLGQISPRAFEQLYWTRISALQGSSSDFEPPFGRPSIAGSMDGTNREVIDPSGVTV